LLTESRANSKPVTHTWT